MKPLHVKIFLPAMLSCLLYSAGTVAQVAYPKALTLTQTERRAVDLKQGMTLEEVEKLLGKPKRTALRAQVGLHESQGDRKSTRLNSSHTVISYAVFCLKKKKQRRPLQR